MQAHNKRQMIIHAGFHKTGTSTVQSVLKAQHRRLSPHVNVIIKTDIPALCQAALAYSDEPTTSHLAAYQAEATACFGEATDDPRPVLISA
jgi:hypothetical protein